MGRRGLRGLRGAVAFLTVLPVDRRGVVTAADVGRGVPWFPLVGAALGGAAALTGWAVSLVLPATVAGLAAVATGAVLTGGLHLDGLADTADGYGGRTRERALAIMRDHAVGSYGVVAVVLDVGLRAAATAALLGRQRGVLALVAAGALSRAASAGLGALLPNARPEGGQAGLLVDSGRARAGLAAAVGAAVAALCLGWRGLAGALLAAAVAALWGRHCLRRLGGVTGDTLGAVSEAVEVLVLLLAAAAP